MAATTSIFTTAFGETPSPGPSTPAPLTPVEKLGQDFAKVYTSGELITRQPLESSAIYLIATLIAMFIEYLFAISTQVNSKFFQQLFAVQVQESLVIGATLLLLILVTSWIPDMQENWAIAFTAAEISLIFMVVWFVGITSVVALLTGRMSKQMESFETTRMGGGSQEEVTPQEMLFAKATTRFKMTMMANGYDKPLVFAKYLFRAQKRLLCNLGNLNWKVWLSMSVPTVFNAVRAGAMADAEESGSASIALFIFWQGGMPLAMFLVLYKIINNRVVDYLEKDYEELEKRVRSNDANLADTQEGDVVPFTKEELTDPKGYLIRSSLENTLALLQICMIQICWYGAIHIMSMYAKIFKQNGGVAFVLFTFSLLPPVLFTWLMPWTLTVIGMLSSLETELDEKFVTQCYRRLEMDGLAELLVVKNQAAEDDKKKQEFSVNNQQAIQDALDAKMAAEAAKTRRDNLVDDYGRPLARRLPVRPLVVDDDALSRMSKTRQYALEQQEMD